MSLQAVPDKGMIRSTVINAIQDRTVSTAMRNTVYRPDAPSGKEVSDD